MRLAGFLCLVAVAVPARAEAPLSRESVRQDPAGKALLSEGYRFCNDGEYELRGHREAAVCDLAAAAAERCPGFAGACERFQAALEEKPKDLRLGETNPAVWRAMSAVARGLLWLVLAALLAWLLVVIYRVVRDRRASPEPALEAAPADAEVEEAARPLVKSGAVALLESAQEAARRGDFLVAVRHAYAAMLWHLDSQGLIELHPARTSGEYLRAVRSRRELYTVMRQLAVEVDKLEFGAEHADAQLFARVWQAVLPIVRSALVLLLLALPGCGELEKLTRHSDPGHAADGFHLLRQLLESSGATVERRVRGINAIGEHVEGVIVLGPVEAAEWEVLLAWAEGGGHLVVATDPFEVASRIGAEWLRLPGHGVCPVPTYIVPSAVDVAWDPSVAAAVPEAPAQQQQQDQAAVPAEEAPEKPEADDDDDAKDDDGEAPQAGRHEDEEEEEEDYDDDEYADGPYDDEVELTYVALADSGLTLNDERFDSIGGCSGEPYAAWRPTSGDGEIMVMADSRALTNAALAAGDNARITLHLLPHVGAVELVGSWTHRGQSSPYAAVAGGKLFPAAMHFLVLVLAVVLWRWPFGTPRDPAARSRRAFLEHVQVLGLHYERTRASRHALGAYAAWALEQLRRRVQPHDRKDLEELARGVAARTGDPLEQVQRVLGQAAAAVHDSGPGAPEHDLPAMQELQRLVQKATRSD